MILRLCGMKSEPSYCRSRAGRLFQAVDRGEFVAPPGFSARCNHVYVLDDGYGSSALDASRTLKPQS